MYSWHNISHHSKRVLKLSNLLYKANIQDACNMQSKIAKNIKVQ